MFASIALDYSNIHNNILFIIIFITNASYLPPFGRKLLGYEVKIILLYF